jgi:hypothetical protein
MWWVFGGLGIFVHFNNPPVVRQAYRCPPVHAPQQALKPGRIPLCQLAKPTLQGGFRRGRGIFKTQAQPALITLANPQAKIVLRLKGRVHSQYPLDGINATALTPFIPTFELGRQSFAYHPARALNGD